jgi:hypothetical protein
MFDEKIMPWARYILACHCPTIALVVVAVTANHARADAVVVTRAMQASTVAEIFIEEKQIRAEIEVGAADMAAFVNVLSDELYEKITGHARPLEERLRTFFESDWVVRADGRTLRGKLERLVAAKRIVRDNVTGEALADQPSDAELVVRITLSYELADHPHSLTFRPPASGNAATANIGFVCYHSGLPVNDFRYMSGEVTLDLDWDDPWYSRFRHPNLRRQFDAPLSAYLYIEPYEVRKEIIVRPKDLQAWLDLDLRTDGVIPVDQQEKLKERVADFLSEMNPVTIDGQPAQGRLDRIHFIHRTLRATGIIEPAVDLDATSATLGVIFVYPVDTLPEKVSMKWELFSPQIQAIPAVASDEAGGLPAEVTPGDPILEWKNYLTNPTSPQMMTVARPPSKRRFAVPIFSVFCGGVVVAMIAVLRRRWSMGKGVSRIALATSIAAIVVGVISLPIARVTIADPFEERHILSAQAAEEVVSSLLYNVYRSFDRHDENLIYDRLAKSISGELLSVVYLETRKSMEVKNQGGLRISVKEVTVAELESVAEDPAEPTFRCRWRVSGWIGHWGHIHARANEHVALITIAHRDGVWKITAIEMLDEQPLEPLRKPGLRESGAGA